MTHPLVYFGAGCMVGIVAICTLLDALARDRSVWTDAVVVKICSSGDMVYRLADGRHAIPRGGLIDDVNTVCSASAP